MFVAFSSFASSNHPNSPSGSNTRIIYGIPCADQSLNLNTATHSSFACEAGAGLAYAFNNRFSFSLEYLYADLGNVQTSGAGFTGTITTPVLVPTNFKLTSQAALFGLHVAI
jgi:opacity protein-like surface antigen